MPGDLLDWAIGHESRFVPTVIDYQGQKRQDATFRVSRGTRGFGPLEGRLRQHILAAAPAWIAEFGVVPSKVERVELEFVAHNDGAFFKRHIDTETGSNWAEGGMRVLSGVYYVHRRPKAFSSGRLRLFSFDDRDNSFIDVEPEHNTLVLFPSWAAHEVLPVSCPSREFADSRFAINVWLRAGGAPA